MNIREIWNTYVPAGPRRNITLIITGALLVAMVLGFTLASYFKHRNQDVTCEGDACPSAEVTLAPGASATPQTAQLVPANLNGAMVAAGKDNLRPLAVIIENHPDARPQSGLGSASLVYEAIAEGGITRFLSVYSDPTQDVKVGPVRSARTYFVDEVTELNALFGHVGGNMDALDQIKATNVADLDQFAVGAAAYHRESGRNVATEHTMYSSTALLWKVATQDRKFSDKADFTPWNFTDDAPTADRGTAQTVNVNFSSASFAVQWNYDPASNSYSRKLGGAPHIDANTNNPITAKTIILQTVQSRPTVTRINENGFIFTLTGSGPAQVIQNGKAIKATWKKEGTGRTRYYDEQGNEIAFVRGEIWVELIHPETKVTVQ